MRDELRALAKLGEIDLSAADLDKELKAIPAKLEEQRANLNHLEQLLAMERNQLGDAERLKSAQALEASQRSEMLARAKAKGAKARNAREAEAAEREVDAVRRTMREREEEAGKLHDAIAKVEASLSQHETEFEGFRTLFSAEETAAKARLAELEVERAKALEGRDQVVAKLPPVVVKRYERVREKRGAGVAEVIDGTCQGCRLHVPPQQFIQIQRCEGVEQCPHCLRLLYFKPSIED
jgi:predicted  nucleic acid-binding Zn-ribbon protein